MEDKIILRDIVYSNSGMQLDLYLPAEVSKSLPLIVWIHGGGWIRGDKDGTTGTRPPFQSMGKGFVFASINYRLSHQSSFPAQIHDCKAAIRWLHAHAAEYHIDSKLIGVWGASAGGQLAALLGTSSEIKELEGSGGNPKYSSSVQAVCDFFGPNDLLRMSRMKGEIDKESPESLYIGGPLQRNVEKAIEANPITHIGNKTPPFLIVHGDKDVVVPLDQSQILHAALKKARVEADLFIVPGAGHGFADASKTQMDEIYGMSFDFFSRVLKQG